MMTCATLLEGVTVRRKTSFNLCVAASFRCCSSDITQDTNEGSNMDVMFFCFGFFSSKTKCMLCYANESHMALK